MTEFWRSSTSLICQLVLVIFAWFSSLFHLLWSHFYRCFCFVFALALSIFAEIVHVWTLVLILRAAYCDLFFFALSISVLALAGNSVGGLIIIWMQGASVDVSGMRIPALWVHLSLLDIPVIQCTIFHHYSISCTVSSL
jgi:hypothetical protein